jgi:hypothetical protein
MKTQYSDLQSRTRRLHRENMMRSLMHRIEAAKGNQVLTEQLQKEQQELGL